MPLLHDADDQHQRRTGHENQRLADVDAAQKQAGNQNRRVGERGSQVGLNQHQHHGNADQHKALKMSFQVRRAPAQIGKVAGHSQNQNQLDPLGGLKVHGADADPALCAQHLVSHQLDRHQRQQADAVGPGNPIQQPVIVDFGEEEHGRQAAGDPKQLLGVNMEIGVLGVQRGRVDLEDGDRAERQHHAEQRPVEVAKAQEAAHQGWPSLKRSGMASSQAGKRGCALARSPVSGLGSTKKWPA